MMGRNTDAQERNISPESCASQLQTKKHIAKHQDKGVMEGCKLNEKSSRILFKYQRQSSAPLAAATFDAIEAHADCMLTLTSPSMCTAPGCRRK
jgi:hypothetical protein